MVKIYGDSGSLSDLIKIIKDEKIKTIKDVSFFKNNFKNELKSIIDNNRLKLNSYFLELKEKVDEIGKKEILEKEKKKKQLDDIIKELELKQIEIKRLKGSDSGYFSNLIIKIKLRYFSYKITNIRNNYNNIIELSIKNLKREKNKLEEEINFIENNFDKKLEDLGKEETERINRINNLINENKFLVYGAIGELKVIKELKKLPDNFYLINNYKRKFNSPIYNKQEDDRIYSIQIDHLVIGPTGIFIIETKNWSKKSIEITDSFSPIKQVERVGFALFVLINNAIKNKKLSSLKSNWGFRKISPNKIVVSINEVPYNNFQYVKVVSIDSLISFVKNRKQEFSLEEAKSIFDYLLNSNDNLRIIKLNHKYYARRFCKKFNKRKNWGGNF